MQYIKITQEQRQQLMNQFETFLSNGRFSDGRIKFDEPLDKVLDKTVLKPVIMFTPTAWLKMRQLVMEADSEIGWHGTVEHQPNSAIYIIKDILVYPQTVTAATVTTDDLEYSTWLQKFPDPIFNKIRFQGHSHVNMGTSPSGVDQHFYDKILQTLEEGDYYIFMITNKRSDLTLFVYDYAQNIIFNEKDITIRILDKAGDIKTWAEKEIKDKVKRLTPISNVHYYGNQPTVTPAGYNKRVDEMTMEEYYERFGRFKSADELIDPKISSLNNERRGPGKPPKDKEAKKDKKDKKNKKDNDLPVYGKDETGRYFINYRGEKVYY